MKPNLRAWRWTAVVLGVVGLALAMPSHAETSGRIDLFAGQRSLDSDFGPADDPTQIGVALSIGRVGWPVQIAIDLMQGSDDGSEATTLLSSPVTGEADVDITEIDLGVRRTVGETEWRWYYGGGLAWVDAEAETSIRDSSGVLFESENDDDTYGLWLNLGGHWHFNDRFQAGIDLRYTDAEVNIGGLELDAGGLQYGLTVGYRW